MTEQNSTSSGSPLDPTLLDRRFPESAREAPRSLWAVIRYLGPGLIIAANIVGSGELIMTTKTGAEAGIALLWLILIGCVVKVFVQLELGRFSISHGLTTLAALDRVPGPRAGFGRDAHGRRGQSWVVCLWFFMMLTTVGQLGGIVGGVGQALAITLPFTGDYKAAVLVPSEGEVRNYLKWTEQIAATEADPEADTEFSRLTAEQRQQVERRVKWIGTALEDQGEAGTRIRDGVAAAMAREEDVALDVQALMSPGTWDDKVWASIISIMTAVVLFLGRYGFIQSFSVVLVVSFSLVTIGNVIALQTTDLALTSEKLLSGLAFRFPRIFEGRDPLVIAFATFGIIGVGATELVAYPYWCLERGYAKFAGPRDDSDAWARRALGWVRVMRWDALASMVIYTIATAAFYLMGVIVLHQDGRNPEGMRMVSTLAQSYIPIFGPAAPWIFLGGAIAVLYSTFLVANASNARMVSDYLRVSHVTSYDSYLLHVRWLSVALPLACGFMYIVLPRPVLLIAIAGMTQAIMLPVLGFCAVWFRFRQTDRRIIQGPAWSAALIVSWLALLIAGGYGAYAALSNLLK